jgi:3-deoxy-manno-octulosonate cytidylyltransferase (CMP-KDO synthetase)
MIQHVYACAKCCADVSEVYVATDDTRILGCVRSFGGKALLTGEGHPSGTDRVAEAARKIGLEPDDVVVNIQGDQPLFRPELVSQMLAPLLQDGGITMSTLIYPISDDKELNNPNCVKIVTDARGYALFFSRSPIPFYRESENSRTYYKHLGFYAYRMGFLSTFASLPVGALESAEKLEPLRALEYGFSIKVVEALFDSIEVDCPADVRRVEEMLERHSEPEP